MKLYLYWTLQQTLLEQKKNRTYKNMKETKKELDFG